MKKKSRTVIIIMLVIIAISVIIEAILHHPEEGVIWEVVPGADAVIGFIGALILIVVSKRIIGPMLQKREDYNGEDND